MQTLTHRCLVIGMVDTLALATSKVITNHSVISTEFWKLKRGRNACWFATTAFGQLHSCVLEFSKLFFAHSTTSTSRVMYILLNFDVRGVAGHICRLTFFPGLPIVFLPVHTCFSLNGHGNRAVPGVCNQQQSCSRIRLCVSPDVR